MSLAFSLLHLKLSDLVQLVRGHLSPIQRAVLSALIVIEVHAKDVVTKLVEQEVSSVNAFEWISQLRSYVCPLCFLLLFSSVSPDTVHCKPSFGHTMISEYV